MSNNFGWKGVMLEFRILYFSSCGSGCPPDIYDVKMWCGFLRTGFHSSHRRHYCGSGSLIGDLGASSVKVMREGWVVYAAINNTEEWTICKLTALFFNLSISSGVLLVQVLCGDNVNTGCPVFVCMCVRVLSLGHLVEVQTLPDLRRCYVPEVLTQVTVACKCQLRGAADK